MTENNQSRSSGIGFCGALFLLFLGLKLGKVIDWSWWWVTAPLWGPITVVAIIILVVFLMALVLALVCRALNK